jgi:hypothetical protein
MGEMISKPDANPIVLAILNVIVCGLPVGYVMIGQSKKAIAFTIATFMLAFVSFGALGWLPPVVAAYDIYLLGQKLASGQMVGASENGLSFLDSLFKD